MKLMENIWLFLAKRKILSNDQIPRYNSLLLLGNFSDDTSIKLLIPYLSDQDTLLRNAAIRSLKQILARSQKRSMHLNVLKERFQKAELIEKLAVIEILEVFDIEDREKILTNYLSKAEGDLIYAILYALHGTVEISILDRVLEISESPDLLLRRLAYRTWFEGLRSMEDENLMTYATPLIHYLIRSTYEMKDQGEILRYVLSNANRKDLPSAKAYPEFITRYLISLINKWEYDGDIYRSLHNLIVPAYFTFKDDGEGDDRPFILV